MNTSHGKISCAEFEELIIKQSIEDLSADEDRLLFEHLSRCSACRQYELSFSNLKNSLTEELNITPNPSFQKILLNKIKKKAPKRNLFLSDFWAGIKNILEYRVPVYQGLIALAIGLLIFIFTNFLSMTDNGSNLTSFNSTDSTNIYSDSIVVINKILILDQQKVGRSALEDSLLTRFIVNSL